MSWVVGVHGVEWGQPREPPPEDIHKEDEEEGVDGPKYVLVLASLLFYRV